MCIEIEMWENKYQNVNSLCWDHRITVICFVCCLFWFIFVLIFFNENRLITSIKDKKILFFLLYKYSLQVFLLYKYLLYTLQV